MIKSLVVIGGPTAIGKTSVGIALAKKFKSEIISADSRQIYKELSIGTAVPSEAELHSVPHHFIQFLSLTDYYNASMYEVDVLHKLEELHSAMDAVFMVGGSGLYIDAVCNGIDELPTIDMNVRNSLAEKFRSEGLDSIRGLLKQLDPESYDRIDLNNHFRILKALEVSVQTGRPYSSFLTREKRKRSFRIIRVALDMDRSTLYDRINQRVDQMIEAGLVNEVRKVMPFRESNALKTVGYREILRYLDNEIPLEEAVDLIKRNSRKYARKQLTWFRKDGLYPWFHPDDLEGMGRFIENKLSS